MWESIFLTENISKPSDQIVMTLGSLNAALPNLEMIIDFID